MDARRAGLLRRLAAPGAVALLALALIAVEDDEGAGWPTAWEVALVAVGAAALLLRSRQPWLAFAGTTLSALLLGATTEAGPELVPAVLVALYAVGSRSRPRVLVALAVGCAVAIVAAGTLIGGEPLLRGEAAAEAALVVLPLALAPAVRWRRAYVEEHGARVAEAHLQREEHARAAVQEERLRMARELHDVLTHTISTINVQAGVAAHLVDRDPRLAQPALAAIATASREALEELRGLLGVLRATADADGATAPVPALTDLPALVDQRRSAGLPVALHVDPALAERELPPAVQLTAYRVVQEALTNVHRHAPGSAATVSISGTAAAVRVLVTNPVRGTGPAPGDRGPGIGLVGMKERVEAAGGRLHTGFVADGYEVRAELPVGASALGTG